MAAESARERDREPAREPEPMGEAMPTADAGSTLSARDERILVFERQWNSHSGAKEHAIRSEFGLSGARYYQILNALIDSPAAVRHDPMLAGRLQRSRDARSQARAGRAFATSDRAGRDPRQIQESTD